MAMMPYTSTLQTNFFAGVAAGKPMECTGLPSGVKPPEPCVEAHSQVVLWSTWTSFFTNSVLAVYLNPAFGTWSDLHGRKGFIVLGMMMECLPFIAILLYLKDILPLYWYYPAHIIASSVSAYTVALGYLGDVISRENRTVVFGFWAGTFNVSSIIGSSINISGLVRTPEVAAVVALGTVVISTALAAVWLPESLPPAARLAARQRAYEAGVLGGRGLMACVKKPFLSAWTSLKILARNELFMKLTVTVTIFFIVLQETMEFIFQYLQEVAGFDTMDQSIFFAVLGVGGLFTLYVVLWFLFTVVGLSEKSVLIIGIISFALEQLMLSLVHAKWQGYAAIAVGSLGGLAFPAIQAIKSKSVGEEEQGAVQGALVGARSVGQGIGPFFFLILFNGFRSRGLYFPAAPFVAALVLELGALVVASTIRLPSEFLGVQKHAREKKAMRAGGLLDEDQEKTPLLQDNV
ncbi:unnamed protein product [Ostreobium quekettii]|uniref:Uncharacterized protein n=1 Tax=Ostreobium quekettii TaxID=121088 RepID=A0A8S1J554_9CHLO|nr:unnamed protein product [Ostreobium quekettii]